LRRLLRVAVVVVLYVTIIIPIGKFLEAVGKPAYIVVYLHDVPSIVNSILFYAIPITPIAIMSLFYKSWKKWLAVVAATTLVVAFLWLPWLSPLVAGLTAQLPVERAVKKAVENGYEVCGIYRATTEWNTFRYEETLSGFKRCFFVFLRPEPRFYYKLRVNLTINIELLRWKKVNSYTFYGLGTPMSMDIFYVNDWLPDFLTPLGNPIRYGNITLKPYDRSAPRDVVHWFTFNPEPGGEEAKITYTIRLKAEPFTPWS